MMQRLSLSMMLILLGYATLVSVLVGTLFVARSREVESYSSAEQRRWQEWRAEVGRQRESGAPVARRVPESIEPPTLVLLRDYFVTSMVVLLVLSSALYFALAMMVRGALNGPEFEPDLKDRS